MIMKLRLRVAATALVAVVGVVLVPSLAVQAQTQATTPASPLQPAALDRSTLEKRIDELVEGHAKTTGFSGTVLLAKDGKPVVAKGYGYANAEWQIPNATNTKFRIGSVTKQFTSMLVMQLREQGKLALEDSVCRFVTPCPDAWKPVTIHHLLTHTSGIPTYTGLAAWREVNMLPRTPEQIVAFFRDLPLQWAPGERYAYNNSGYFLLGVVIEKITGKKYEQVLQDLILTPLGMADTGYDWHRTIIARRADGYTGTGTSLSNAPPLDMGHPYAAGALYSTVDDLLKWDRALYTTRLLPEAAKQIMWTPFRDGYAYGWGINEPVPGVFGGHRRIAHGGGINGFSAFIARLPEPRVTIIVLCNNDDIAAIYYGHKYEVPSVPVVATIDPSILDLYVGEYEIKPGATILVTRQGSGLGIQPTGGRRVDALPASETKFFVTTPPITFTFVKDSAGRVTQLLITQSGNETQARKIR
jgi:CubicO group peptidase (beta-lactamase class C family)